MHTDIAALIVADQTKAPTRIHVKSDIMAGQRISGENPTYPQEARDKKIQGAVVLDAVIGRDGMVEKLDVVRSPDKLLSASAMEAVRTWRYRPYLLIGDPIEVETTINVIYNLKG
jgi:periplasmic protein TonB